jgi:hypothetical protein
LAIALYIALSVTLGLGLAATVPVLRRLFRKPLLDEITPEWLESFSLDRYRSMSSLLSDDDFAFLSRQPGFDLSLYKKLRRERLAIFRQYLDRLIIDFNRLHVTARALVASSTHDSSAVATQLIAVQFQFYKAVFRTEVSYRLCRLGLCSVNVQLVLAPLQTLSEQLSELAVPDFA